MENTIVCQRDDCKTIYPSDTKKRDLSYMFCVSCNQHVMESIRYIVHDKR